jgi:hypothetical protein
MNTATLPTWDMLTADGNARRLALFHHIRSWAAQRHVTRHGDATPSRVLAALDASARPMRTRLAGLDAGTTQRDMAEAVADDLWDAACVAWAMVRAVPRLEGPPMEHIVAELAATGRWLAAFPVHVAGHDKALAELFNTAEVLA